MVGVQIIASYTVVIGAVNMISLLTGRTSEVAERSETAAVVECVQTFVDSLALLFGLQGLCGVMLRDSRRLRVLFMYHIAEIIVSSIAIIFREAEVCEELARMQKAKKMLKINCTQASLALFIEFCIHALFFGYFAYITWSAVTRLEAGDLRDRPGALFGVGEYEMADRFAFADPFPPWWVMGHPSADASLHHQRVPHRGPPTGPSPFSGAPRNLAEMQARPREPQQPLQPPPTIEPFAGTPHRLE